MDNQILVAAKSILLLSAALLFLITSYLVYNNPTLNYDLQSQKIKQDQSLAEDELETLKA